MVRDALLVLPDLVKVAWRRMRRRVEGVVLGVIDRYLAGRGEERAVASPAVPWVQTDR